MNSEKTETQRISHAIAKNERRIKTGKPNEPGRETWEERRVRLVKLLLVKS